MRVAARKLGTSQEYGLTRLPRISNTLSNSMSDAERILDRLENEFTDEDALSSLSQFAEFRDVRAISLRIDTRKSMLLDIGAKLPELRHLKLMYSYVAAIRDLGSSLINLRILCMPRCHLKTLDGISSMPHISELYLAFNDIDDLTPCALLDGLEILDLEGNKIDGKHNIVNLKVCQHLTTLSLFGNPIIETLGGIKIYRKFVRKILTQLNILDDQPIDNLKPKLASTFDTTHFESEWQYIDQVIREIGLVSRRNATARNDSSVISTTPTPETLRVLPPGRCGQGIRPSSSHSESLQRSPVTSLTSLTTSSTVNSRPSSTSSHPVDYADLQEGTSSNLTTGHIICGGISNALRSRRQSNPVDQSDEKKPDNAKRSTKSALKMFTHKLKSKHNSVTSSNHKNDASKLEEKDALHDSILQQENDLKVQCKEVLEELSAWRKNNAKNSKLFQTKKLDFSRARLEQFDASGDLRLLSPESDCTIQDDRTPSRLDNGTDGKMVHPSSSYNETGDDANEGDSLIPGKNGSEVNSKNLQEIQSVNHGREISRRTASEAVDKKVSDPVTGNLKPSHTLSSGGTTLQLPKIMQSQAKSDELSKRDHSKSRPLKSSSDTKSSLKTNVREPSKSRSKLTLPSKPKVLPQ